MHQRIATALASVALVGALFVGAPQRAAATTYSPDLFVAMSGGGYTGDYASNCNAPDYTTDGTDDQVQIETAIGDADNGATIYLCAGTYDIKAELEDNNKALTLVGAGEGVGGTTLDAWGPTRIIYWVPDGSTDTLTLANMRLYDGHTTNWGGAVYQSGGGLAIDHVTFDANAADCLGGAIYWDNGESDAVATIADATFTSNRAGIDSTCVGGAITVAGSLTVARSTFTDNSSTYGGGAVVSQPLGSSTLNIHDSIFTGNDSLDDSGGAIRVYYEDASLSHNVYRANRGGAVVVEGAEDDCTVLNVDHDTYIENIATYRGGGIYAGWVDLSVTNSVFTSNVAGTDGGGLYQEGYCASTVADHNTFANNSAGGYGGGAHFDDFGNGLAGADHINYNMFTGNTARSGGGLFTDDTQNQYPSSDDYDAMVMGNSFTRNVATEAGGGLAQSFLSTYEFDHVGKGFPMGVIKNVFRANRAKVGGGAAIDFHSKRSKTQKFLVSMRKNRFIGNRSKSSGNLAVGVFTWGD